MKSIKFYDNLFNDGKFISSFYETDPFHKQKIEFMYEEFVIGKKALNVGCNEGQIREA